MATASDQNFSQRRKGAKNSARTIFASFAPLREIFANNAVSLTLILLSLSGCESPTPATERPKPAQQSHQVTAASYPLAHFTKRLVGDSIEVLTLAPASDSTSSWRPSRAEILSMQQSDIIFVNGTAAPFAKWLPHVTLPDSKICATANDGLALADMISVEDIQIVHSHGPEGEHSHPTMVAYTWLDPAMAAKQVGIMASRLADAYPELKSSITQTEQKLTQELADLSATIDELQRRTKNPVSVLTDSPDLKFLTRALGLNDIHLNWRQPPSISDAETQLKEKLASVKPRPEFMLFSTDPPAELRSAVEALNLRIIVVNRIASQPLDGDYFGVMIKTLNQLQPVFGIRPAAPETKSSDSEQN